MKTPRPEQNLGVRHGDLLDCRADCRANVGQLVYVILLSNPARRYNEYVACDRSRYRAARGGAIDGLYRHAIGAGVLTELARGRYTVRLDDFPSEIP